MNDEELCAIYLKALSDAALSELGALLETRILTGLARLDEFGCLARIHAERARRSKAQTNEPLEGL